MKNTAPIHLVLRLPISQKTGKGSINIVDAHNEVVATRGRVVLAKFGAPPGRQRISALQCSIDESEGSFLYIVSKAQSQDGIAEFRARIARCRDAFTSPCAPFPDYYSCVHLHPGMWFESPVCGLSFRRRLQSLLSQTWSWFQMAAMQMRYSQSAELR